MQSLWTSLNRNENKMRKNKYGLDLDKIEERSVLSTEPIASSFVILFVNTWKEKSHTDILNSKKVSLQCTRCEAWMGAVTPLDKKDISLTNPAIYNENEIRTVKYQSYCVKCIKWAKKERARVVMLEAKRLKRGLEKDWLGYWRDAKGHYLCVHCERLQIHDDDTPIEDKVWYGRESDICDDCQKKLDEKEKKDGGK